MIVVRSVPNLSVRASVWCPGEVPAWETAKLVSGTPANLTVVCKYCNYSFHDGWTKLLEYDDVYQRAHPEPATAQSTHGFHESWDDLKEELEL